MSHEEKGDSQTPEEIPSADGGSKSETAKSPEGTEVVERPAIADGFALLSVDSEPRTEQAASPIAAKKEITELPDANGSSSPPVELSTRADEVARPAAVGATFAKKRQNFLEERPLPAIALAPRILRYQTRRDVLAFGIGAVTAAVGAASLLPQKTLARLGVRRDVNPPGKEWLLNKAIRIDDDVAEALYSRNRMVPTYTKSQITPIKNNYNGDTPDPGYISGWTLTLRGLASGLSVSLDIQNLLIRFPLHEQITRLVCVEGWSAVAWWAGLRFEDLLLTYPPVSQAKWARVESSINLDSSGSPDPYFMSLDLATARHPQTLLATHLNGQRLTVDHGAPMRLLAPVKLGLKNVKAVTAITYMAEEPKDYWAQRGYSRYDGI